jgi:transcriptional regulator with XRE-family HTH domain
MPPNNQSRELGQLIRERREARDISLRQLAEDVEGLDAPYLLRLERGEYRRPHPTILQGLAQTLGIPLSDLYALSGYSATDDLPSLPVFLRSTLDLPKSKIAEIEGYIRKIEDEAHSTRTTPRKKGGPRGKSRR